MRTIVATLSSDSIAAALDRKVTSPSPVLSLCRQLVEVGCASSLPMHVFRAGSSAPCIIVRSIGEAAALHIEGARFRKRGSVMRLTKSSHDPIGD